MIMSSPKRAVIKDIDIDIDIADILDYKYWYPVDIGKHDIDPALVRTLSSRKVAVNQWNTNTVRF